MGQDIERQRFEPEEFAEFAERLEQNLDLLEHTIAKPGFGAGDSSIGAEVEMYLIDDEANPVPKNLDVIRDAHDDRLTIELNRFNLEFNSSPVATEGEPFSALRTEFEEGLRGLRTSAQSHGADINLVGILPTLRIQDLGRDAITDLTRYHALAHYLRVNRGAPFQVHIDGSEPLHLQSNDISPEGASTSFQIHLRVECDAFARTYNAAQLATGPVLAASGNSPFFLGHLLWEETRIALFQQTVDARIEDLKDWHSPARVTFGHGWVRSGIADLFREACALYPVLLPVLSDDEDSGEAPALRELRLHNGTIWRWNRGIYDPVGGGHLRVELRALPAGPTVVDMLANAAFIVGLTQWLSNSADRLVDAMPFEYACWNFYKAAQKGLDARLLWPSSRAPSPKEHRADELVLELLERAADGLAQLKVDSSDSDPLLEVISRRVKSKQTGARWQSQTVLADPASRDQSLTNMLLQYQEYSRSGVPVSDWPTPKAATS
jgi:gamma-glutamyl:cysteine ligase YbdK (ATP-grasp superfamily)